MRVLFLDCFSGISGDMTVGALCDLGVKPSAFEWELSKLALGDFHMHFSRESRQHIAGVKFGIHAGSTHTHDHEHHHHHGEEEHEHTRSHRDIRALLEASELSPFVKQHALSMFQRIAEAEAKIHGMKVEDVVFHEVGALDSIADVVCVCAGLEQLGVEKVFVSHLVDGRGFTKTAHGNFPVPAPATLGILQGIAIEGCDVPFEMITPTGAAIVAEFGASFGAMPRMKVEKVGYGLGSKIFPDRPNALRAVLGDVAGVSDPGYSTDTITRLETNLDDLSPEITGAVVEKLFAAGALDVFLTAIQMKKNRPGVLLTVLCEAEAAGKMTDLLFRETSSFGLRVAEVRRLKLDRRREKVPTPFGEVVVKLGLKNGEIVQVAPEFESVRAASERAGVSLQAVYDAARAAGTAICQ